MPSTYNSASLQKMEGGGMNRRKRFSCGNIIGDPFALATTTIASLGWLLALIASVFSAVNNPSNFAKYNWWSLAFMFFCVLGVTVVIGSDSQRTYSVAIVGYLSAGIVMTSSAVSSTIYSGDPASEAAAAGYILLAVVCIIWTFYFGSQPQSTHRSYVDSFALQKEARQSNRNSRQMSARYTDQNGSQLPQAPQMYSSNQLNGFGTSSPGFSSDAIGSRSSQQPRFGGPGPASPGLNNGFPGRQSQAGLVPTTEEAVNSAANGEYTFRAKAIYSYDANPDDVNEISFVKGESLEVSDVSGRWWQARKANGQTGIAPSNYLILI